MGTNTLVVNSNRLTGCRGEEAAAGPYGDPRRVGASAAIRVHGDQVAASWT